MHSKFFSDFGGGPEGVRQIIVEQPKEAPFPEWYQHNVMVLEIANNFPHVQWLMYQIREKVLKQVAGMQKEWYHFLLNNKIDILNYPKKSGEQFIKDHYKTLD